MAKRSGASIPVELLDAYDRLVAVVPGVERKGATMPYTSLNGHMFSYLGDGHLVLRLPSGDREAFLDRYLTTLHGAYGIVQKEYVDVPDALFANTAELAPWFESSPTYVAGLKPKATTRRTS
jgi:hypothetical protein